MTWEHVVERNEEHVKHGTLFAKNKLNHFDLQKSNLESYDINMQIQDEDTIEKYSSRCHLTFLPMLKFGQYFPFKCLLGSLKKPKKNGLYHSNNILEMMCNESKCNSIDGVIQICFEYTNQGSRLIDLDWHCLHPK